MTLDDNASSADVWRDFYEENSPLRGAADAINTAYNILHESLRQGQQVLVCGNGGSASDSEHIAGELAKSCAIARPLSVDQRTSLRNAGDDGYLADHLQQGLRVWPLVSQAALITAIANDQGGDLIFAQQVMAYGRSGDVLWVLTTSGNSTNVLHAVRVAKALGLKTLAFTGEKRGRVGELCDVTVALPGRDTPTIQHAHQLAYHAVCLALEASFYG